MGRGGLISAPSASGFFIACVASVSVWSLTLVPRSLLLNRTETLATQARFFSLVMTISSHQREKRKHRPFTFTQPLPYNNFCFEFS